MDRLSAFARIKQRSLFAMLDEIDAFALAGTASVVEVAAGAEVPRPDGATTLFLVVTGEVTQRVLVDAGEQATRHGPGRALEVASFLARAPRWEGRWFCAEDTVLLALPGDEVHATLDATPGLARYLERTTRDAGVRKLENDLRLVGATPAEVVALVAALERVPFDRLAPRLAALGPTLVVVDEGRVDADVVVEGTREAASPLRRGDVAVLDAGLERLRAEPGTHVWALPQGTWQARARRVELEAFRALADPITVKRAAIQAALRIPAEPPPPEVVLPDDDLTVADFKVDEATLARLHARRLPFVPQHDEMDCAAACMSMVARFHGRRVDVAAFRSLIHVTREGASMLSIKRAAERVGFRVLGVSSGLRGLRKLQVPMIALLDYHYVVVHAVTEAEVRYADPAVGLVVATPEVFEQRWSRSALVLAPTEALRRFPESEPMALKYLELFRGNGLLLFEVLLASALMFVLGLAMPVALQYVVDGVLPSGSAGTLTLLALGLLGARLVHAVLSWSHRALLVEITSRFDALASALFVRRLLSMPLGFFAIRTVGDVTQRMAELRKIRGLVLDQSVELLTILLGGVVNAAVIGLYDPYTLLVLVVGLVLPFVVVRALAPRVADTLRAAYKAAGDWQTRAFEHFDGLGSVKAMGGEVAARWRWAQDLGRNLTLRRRLGRLEALTRGASTFFEQALNLGLLLYAIHAYSVGRLTAGHVLAIAMLGGVVVSAAMTLMNGWQDLGELAVSLGRVDDVITSAEEPRGPPVRGASPASAAPSGLGAEAAALELGGRVDVEGVSFQYGGELSPVVLSGVSLSVAAGETVALVGKSGSGKSTLGYMFNLLYQPTHGRILFDGRPHDTLPLDALRRATAMIVQDNAIFSGTILENIALGDPSPAFERVLEAARLADAHDFVTALPRGYATTLGEGGEGLSGGQRQRINIARALYRGPRILIMDEATSALDAVSEARIVKNLRARRGTTIVIAHRLNTVMHADRIVVLDRGRIVEQGTHAELLARRGHYGRLFAKQLAL